MAKRIHAPFLWRHWSHDFTLTLTLVTFLRPWLRRFMKIIDAWWHRSNRKFTRIWRNSQSIGKLDTPYRPFAVNSSVHVVKKFEWQLIFCLNALIFISLTHMQKFSTYFPAVFFNLTWKLASKMRMNTIRQPESINHKIELLGDFHFNEFLKTALDQVLR